MIILWLVRVVSGWGVHICQPMIILQIFIVGEKNYYYFMDGGVSEWVGGVYIYQLNL